MHHPKRYPVNFLLNCCINNEVFRVFLKNITTVENPEMEMDENRFLENKMSRKESKKEEVITIPKFLARFYFKLIKIFFE